MPEFVQWCSEGFGEKDTNGDLRIYDCAREKEHSGQHDSPLAQERRRTDLEIKADQLMNKEVA